MNISRKKIVYQAKNQYSVTIHINLIRNRLNSLCLARYWNYLVVGYKKQDFILNNVDQTSVGQISIALFTFDQKLKEPNDIS